MLVTILWWWIYSWDPKVTYIEAKGIQTQFFTTPDMACYDILLVLSNLGYSLYGYFNIAALMNYLRFLLGHMNLVSSCYCFVISWM